MIRVTLGAAASRVATMRVDPGTARHARHIYRNARRSGLTPLIARFAVGQFLADRICGNVDWRPFA